MENNTPKKNAGGRPQRPLTEDELAKLFSRPEVSNVIQGIVNQAVASLAPAGAPVASAAAGHSTTENEMERLGRSFAMAAAQLADPRKKPLDPQELQARQDARGRMNVLIAEANARGDVPEYELIRECYIEEQLISATYIGADRVVRRQVIGWGKIPNQAMVPINDVARAIYAEYLRSVGGKPTEGQMPSKDRAGHLKVFTNGKLESIPEARAPGQRMHNVGGLSLRGNALPGQVIETAVLGSVHPAAKQIA